jgi:hypothetical protein
MHVFSNRLLGKACFLPSPPSAARPAPDVPPPMEQVVARRLEIARRGLDEARRHLGDGRPGDAEMILDKVDEDLHLLRKRLHHTAGQTN